MKPKEGRDIVINRVRKELIGPGSDIFLCIAKIFFGNFVSKANTI